MERLGHACRRSRCFRFAATAGGCWRPGRGWQVDIAPYNQNRHPTHVERRVCCHPGKFHRTPRRSSDFCMFAALFLIFTTLTSTQIPLLNNTSIAPSIVLINSLASLIPAPTRSIYASTKAASLVLYQALAIEHPRIKFSNIIPSTVEGDFRASAVDSGPVRESNPNKTGLKKEDVALRCIQAADNAERTVFMPATMRYVHFLFWIIPSFVERMAAKKYNYTP